jgi:hypothetical protein
MVKKSGKEQKTHHYGVVFTGRVGKLTREAQASTHVMGFLYS